MNLRMLIVLFLPMATTLSGQPFDHDVFPEWSGPALLEQLRKEYRPQNVLNYGQARDTLFFNIDSFNDTLECVYTGYKAFLPPSKDPTKAAYKQKINTEHTYPQNKGARKGNAKSDMHHLYAVRVNVNSTRGNLPFKAISNDQAKRWYIGEETLLDPPASNSGAYSKWDGNFFEPRDVHKGNLARSIFYFYTIYQQQALEEDETFFSLMLPDLCKWHELDPVDAREWERNQKIAFYQDNKLNPFILDEDLPSRTYCKTNRNKLVGPPRQDVFPKPYFFEINQDSKNLNVQYFLQNAYTMNLGIYSANGLKLKALVNKQQKPGYYSVSTPATDDAGFVYIILQNEKSTVFEKIDLRELGKRK